MSVNNLSKLINTDYLVKYLTDDAGIDGKPEEDQLFIKSSKIKSYIDKKVPKNLQNKYQDAIDQLIGYDVDYEEFEFKDVDGKFYKSDEHNVTFGYLKYDGEDNEKEHVYVLSLNGKDEELFMMIGNAGSHPYIMTDTFVYDNSDGSGPGKFRIQDEDKVSYDIIIHKIATYFTLFCDDSFH